MVCIQSQNWFYKYSGIDKKKNILRNFFLAYNRCKKVFKKTIYKCHNDQV